MIGIASMARAKLDRIKRLMDPPALEGSPRVEEQPPFFMVWRPTGSAPTKRHATRGSAEHEAERLARRYPGHDVFVMVPASRIKAARVDREDFTRLHGMDCMCQRCMAYDDEVPF
ncbi:hypothetical protein [Sphingobium sp. YR657]|uniref:hypothetical protein n=1 Tax=Sphingobium sp. YR657 TaxID=1884366 RepID=UPI0031381345